MTRGYVFRRGLVAVLVAASSCLGLIFGRSEYVPCTEARANSLLKVGCLHRGQSPFLVCSLAFSMVFGQKCLGECR